jgi:serine/threonine-protein kinase
VSADYPRQGDKIGHYRVGRRLGGGGMGVVFEARDEYLERPVALKVIAPELAEDAEFRARFTREAQAQASLDSRHVVQVYAHGEDQGRLWIATQLVPDGDLRSMLTSHGAPSVPVAIDLIEQVADGLADAHTAGLVHRDIKPANVLLRRRADGGLTAYLADFGIARQVGGEATRTSHATVGTPSYMAPELHTGGQPGVASDVYSLGCLLWATLTGRAPYAGTSDFEIVTAHREEPIPQLPDDSPLAGRLNELLRRTLAKDPAERPTSATAVRDWLRSLRGPVAPAAPPGPPRRGRLLAVVLVAAVVVVAVAVAYAVTRDDDDEPGGSPRSPESSQSTTSSPPASTSPSVTAAPAGGRKERAVASMAAAFAEQPSITLDQARCVARTTIEAVGLERLADIGMFDSTMTFQDVDLAAYPDVKDALASATFTCVVA